MLRVLNPQEPWRPFPRFLLRKGCENFFLAKNPRNSLISHDSDERIQGNPRQSNAHNWGSSQRKGRSPRKPKRTEDLFGRRLRLRLGEMALEVVHGGELERALARFGLDRAVGEDLVIRSEEHTSELQS